jgi:hypothetical protein
MAERSFSDQNTPLENPVDLQTATIEHLERRLALYFQEKNLVQHSVKIRNKIISAALKLISGKPTWRVALNLLINHDNLNSDLKNFLGWLYMPSNPDSLWGRFDWILLSQLVIVVETLAKMSPDFASES